MPYSSHWDRDFYRLIEDWEPDLLCQVFDLIFLPFLSFFFASPQFLHCHARRAAVGVMLTYCMAPDATARCAFDGCTRCERLKEGRRATDRFTRETWKAWL